MRKKNLSLKVAVGVLSLALVAMGGISLAKMYSGSSGTVIENAQVVNIGGQSLVGQSAPNENGGGMIGASAQSQPTYLTSYDSYTPMPSFYLWNTDGGLEVAGFTYLNGLSTSGGASFASTTLGGAVTTINITVPTTTITAAQFCDSSFITINASSTGIGYVNDVALPGTSTLFSACLNANGKTHSVLLFNASSTVPGSSIYSGAGNVLIASPTTTAAVADGWAGGDYRRLVITRISSNTTTAELYGLRDAD